MKETLNEIEKRVMVEMGRRGGLARAKKMTRKQRSDSARKAIHARWSKKAKAVV